MQLYERFANHSYLELLYLNDRTSQVGYEQNRPHYFPIQLLYKIWTDRPFYAGNSNINTYDESTLKTRH